MYNKKKKRERPVRRPDTGVSMSVALVVVAIWAGIFVHYGMSREFALYSGLVFVGAFTLFLMK